MANKARYWVGVLYPENMIPDWEDEIGDRVQVPYAYCVHDKSVTKDGDPRKVHVHIILAFSNTTTYDHVLDVFDTLSAEGKKAVNTVQKVINIRSSYNYLIHDTDDCRKKGKEPYPPASRVTGNNFDIGAYEQLSTEEKNAIRRTLMQDIMSEGFTNINELYEFIELNYADDVNYIDCFATNSALFERMTKANYLRRYPTYSLPVASAPGVKGTPFSVKGTPFTTPLKCCPKCGSIEIKKNGKALGGKQKLVCKDCGNRFEE